MVEQIRPFIWKLLCSFLMSLTFIYSNAQTNYALSLDGVSQYAAIGAPITTNSSYTKEAWVYATNVTGARNIISALNSPFWINAGYLAAGQAGNYTLVSDPSLFPVNRWVHVAVTYDAPTTTMKLYRDGILVSTNTSVSAYTNASEFIGSHGGTASYFAGLIDEVRIWNIALTPSQIRNISYLWPANNASGLVSYYKCNQGSGTTLTNSTGGTNGTLQNSAGWSASPVQYSANALSFDGVDDYVTIPASSSLNITSAITMEAWVYATKNSGIQNVLSKSSNGVNNGYIFPRTDDGWATAVLYLHIAGSWRLLAAAYPSLNAWHHLAATYDGAMMKLYIDGVLSASVAQTGTIAVNSNPLTLGNQTGFSEYFGGIADELRLWNVARTQAQIQANMNKELDPSTQTGLVSYYNFYEGIRGGNNNGLVSANDLAGNTNGTLTNFAVTGTTSNYVAQNFSLATLPVRWHGFSLKREGSGILLQWSTESEEHTKDFIVQHSTNGVTWTAIGTISAAGNSETVKDYHYLHPFPSQGTHFYRILQSDIDGKMSYSEIRSIKLEASEKAFAVINDYNGTVHFRLNKPGLVSLYSSEGRLIWQMQAGTALLTLPRQPKGIYLLNANQQTERIFMR